MTEFGSVVKSLFMGPKAENAEALERMLLEILRDHIHWRRNYFPADRRLIDKQTQRQFEGTSDKLDGLVADLLAALRRNFPFYSPRYLAHQLSDVSLPAFVGVTAGLLYNPNNVTPEAAPVTVELELEACAAILEMLGFKAPPEPPPLPCTPSEHKDYQDKLLEEFGWAHITSGGTVANIEALWVARNVRYFPLSVQEACVAHEIGMTIKLPSSAAKHPKEVDIRTCSIEQLLALKPNESIYLKAEFIKAVAVAKEVQLGAAQDMASNYLAEAETSPAGGVANQVWVGQGKYQPVVFVSGAGHYSIKKAADILGIGAKNVIQVDTDESFRLSVRDLERKLRDAVRRGQVPVAVVVIAGTTEEGAVDPLHEVVALRSRLEKDDISFWIHIDAAWGGYFRTLFRPTDYDLARTVLSRVGKASEVPFEGDYAQWIENFLGKVGTQQFAAKWGAVQEMPCGNEGEKKQLHRGLKRLIERYFPEQDSGSRPARHEAPTGNNADDLLRRLGERTDAESAGLSHEEWLAELRKSLGDANVDLAFSVAERQRVSAEQFGLAPLKVLRELAAILGDQDLQDEALASELTVTPRDYAQLVCKQSTEKISIQQEKYSKKVKLQYGGDFGITDSFLSFGAADSITVDPHKMGYCGYPAGVVAFRNDRVRHFILQTAPYITSASHSDLVHYPPRYRENHDAPVSIDAFAPFILEGSKPGAIACGLWLASKAIPLDASGHGQLVRESVLGARELYERIVHWPTAVAANHWECAFELVSAVPHPPDTNIVIFLVKRASAPTLLKLNELTKAVYGSFTIQAELGERQYSYSQTFFLSRTRLCQENYSFSSLSSLIKRLRVHTDQAEYEKSGLWVLRATVMNPYIAGLRREQRQNVLAEFMADLTEAAKTAEKAML